MKIQSFKHDRKLTQFPIKALISPMTAGSSEGYSADDRFGSWGLWLGIVYKLYGHSAEQPDLTLTEKKHIYITLIND